jgi:hypothetical protein
MVDENDWRLQGQEKYLSGVALHWKKWKKPREDWDHDHCAFCKAKFMEEKGPDILNEGYTTTDDYHWVCKTCFDDFKDMFHWVVQ